MNLIILGAPGAGKGTQSAFLTERFHIPQISTGEMLRAERRADSPLGKLAAPYMDGGSLVPDDLMIKIIERRLQQPDAANGFILDGFPRTIPQAQALDRMLADLGKQIEKVVYLKVDRHALIDRLLHRGTRSERTDDTPDVVTRRIDVFLSDTAPLIDYYRAQNKLESVDGEAGVEAVRSDVLNRLTGPNGKNRR